MNNLIAGVKYGIVALFKVGCPSIDGELWHRFDYGNVCNCGAVLQDPNAHLGATAE